MNLLQIRRKFRELSGRYDLVNDDYSDNGADFFINEGRKFLDRLDETNKSWASCFKFLDIGHFSVSFPYCRAIKEVWAGSASGNRWQLEKKSLQDLVTGYLSDFPNSRNQGMPLYYSPCITRHIPDNATVSDIESFVGYVDISSGDNSECNAILLNVPTKEKLTITINGLFYSPELINDEDTNYWSSLHPFLLYMAAMRAIEVNNRNTQGVNDWTNAIMTEMRQLGFDLVEELIAGVDQMEG